MAERLPPGLPVIFCQDSPKRILVSVIKTTPIKPREEPAAALPVPTSPGFSDFMVYPWRWGENAHNVTLSPGGTAALSALPPLCAGTGRAPAGDEEEAGSPGGGGHRHLKVSAAGPGRGEARRAAELKRGESGAARPSPASARRFNVKSFPAAGRARPPVLSGVWGGGRRKAGAGRRQQAEGLRRGSCPPALPPFKIKKKKNNQPKSRKKGCLPFCRFLPVSRGARQGAAGGWRLPTCTCRP